MTRWMAGIVIAFGLMPTLGFAQGPWSAPGVQQAGYPSHVPPPPGASGNWHQPYNDALTQYQLIPDDRGFLQDRGSQFDRVWGETISRSWMKFDYIFWQIKPVGNNFIGAPVVPSPGSPPPDLTGVDPSARISAQDRILGIRSNTFIVVPGINDYNENHLNGARLSLGIPTRVGTLEANVWALEQSVESFSVQPVTQGGFIPVSIIAAVPLLDNGVANDNTMVLFSEDYRVSLSTQVAGTEGNWVFNSLDSAAPFQVAPMLGFRYLRVQDRFTVSGTDIPDPLTLDPITGLPAEILNHNISSRSRNNVFGPQIGFRTSTQLWKFTLSADTKFVLGINRIEEKVATQQIFSVTEDPQLDQNGKTRFTPMLDLGVKLRCDVSEHLSLHAGYDLLLGEGFSRAARNVLYDAPASITEPPAIRLQKDRTGFYAQGFSFGGEVTFW